MPGMLPDFGSMSHADLVALRDRTPANEQSMIAPFEHRAFAREWLKDSPYLAAASLPFAIPAYAAAKAVGLGGKARTPASLDELFAGYHGYAEGMLNNAVPSASAQELHPAVSAYLKANGLEEQMRQRAENKAQDEWDAAQHAQWKAEGSQAWRRLLDIMRGGTPSRDPNYEPPQRQPAPPVYLKDRRPAPSALNSRVNGAPVFNPNPSITPTGEGVRG